VFQFHSGSIQTLSLNNVATSLLCFNSTLVRFKLAMTLMNLYHQNRFNSTLVRFKLAQRSLLAYLQVQVSIPLWFDSNFAVQSMGIGGSNVSIPLWFDSNTSAFAWSAFCFSCFNSTLVRFKHCSKVFWVSRMTCFNSTLVRFKLKSRVSYFDLSKIVSIPLWFDSNARAIQQGI